MPTPNPQAVPQQAPPSSRKGPAVIVVPIVAAVVGLAVGYFLGAGAEGSPIGGGLSRDACYAEATEKLAASGLLLEQPDPAEVRSLSGQVTAVAGRTLTLEVVNLNPNPLSDPTPATRSVTLSEDATIVTREQRDPQEFFQELEAYEEALLASQIDGEATDLGPVPTPFIETEITPAELAVGSTVLVTSNESVYAAESFTATSVSVQQQTTNFDPVTGEPLP